MVAHMVAGVPIPSQIHSLHVPKVWELLILAAHHHDLNLVDWPGPDPKDGPEYALGPKAIL